MLTPPLSAHDHIQGLPDAGIVLVEYGDYECPYCGAAYLVVKELQKRLRHKLSFAFRNFPLANAHPHAELPPKRRGGRRAGQVLGDARPAV